MAIQGKTALVGSRFDSQGGTRSGAVYVFHFDGEEWVEQEVLATSDGADQDHFGIAVDLDDSKILVGANGGDHGGGFNVGYAYGFHKPLALGASSNRVALGETLTLTAAGGLPLQPVMLTVQEVNGSPANFVVEIGRFDAQGLSSVSMDSGPGLQGLLIRCQAFGFYAQGHLGASDWETVRFE